MQVFLLLQKKIIKYFVISHIWTKRDKKSLKFLLAHSKRKAYHLWWTLNSFENDAIEYNLGPVDKDEEEIRQMQKLLNLTVHQMPSSLMVDSLILDIYGSCISTVSSVSPKGCELQDREQAINRRRRNKWSKKLIFVNLFATCFPFELKKKRDNFLLCYFFSWKKGIAFCQWKAHWWTHTEKKQIMKRTHLDAVNFYIFDCWVFCGLT